MNNTTITNIFNSDNRNIVYIIKNQNRQIIAAIAYRILKFESMIKKTIVENYAFFTAITFSMIN